MAPAFSRSAPPSATGGEVDGGPSQADEALSELVEVPAAVVCAVCGEAECVGCVHDAAGEGWASSGVVVFVPWERPRSGFWGRLWATTRAATEGAESFFGNLPEGPVGPAFTYALSAELLAVGTTVLCWGALVLGVAYAAMPRLMALLLTNPVSLAALGRVVLTAWVGFTVVLLVARVLHGLSLDRAARRSGAPARPHAALRFGLYAAGVDVATSPFGVLAAVASGGPRALGQVVRHARATPAVATSAFLYGIYRLDDQGVRFARRRALVITLAASVVLAAAALVAMVFAAAW